MKKILIGMLSLIGLPMMMSAQNYNPFVAQGVISPSPLYNVASNGSGQISFLVGNSGDDVIPLITNQEMLLSITLSKGIPYNVNPLAALGGTFASYFNWVYDPITKSYLGTQNQTIPDALDGGVGTITVQYQVTTNSLESNPQNGFAVTITPPAYTVGINSVNDDQVSSYTWAVPRLEPLPDENATLANVTLSGNVHTNDVVPAGSIYSAPAVNGSNPSSCAPLMNSNGTYTFNCSTAGEYNFLIPVCEPGTSGRCMNVPLIITVLDTTVSTNAPIANIDMATTYQGNAVSINILANDRCENGLGCNLSSPIIVTGPSVLGATAIVNADGTVTYTPALNYVGTDSLKYNVCDNQSPVAKCDAEWVYISVLALGNPNTTLANDDYTQTTIGTPVSGNVKLNDLDPEEDVQTVTAQTTTAIGKGTLVLNTNGAFLFTPVSTFTGSVDFPYTICDNSNQQACATATLHVVVAFKGGSALPVKLTYFTADATACDAHLKWGTSQEDNITSFDVMRKGAEDQDYKLIGSVASGGKSSVPKEYSYTDAQVSNGKYEYMIKTTDIDSKIEFSESRLVTISCTKEITVYPNPATDYINVGLNAMSKTIYEIKVTDVDGKVLTETETMVDKGSKTVRLSTAHIASGVYNVTVTSNGDTQTFKVRIAN